MELQAQSSLTILALALFASRFVQAFASNAIFVLGLATIAENIPSERICQTMGIVTSAVSVGTSAGTMLAGVLLELFGYWPTWSTAFALIAVDAISRLLMIEKEKGEQRHSS
jgi:MFS family permease